ncbi:type 4a pilus biogenesis protein PilO [Halobacteriovorax sp. BALOs_7]|uniref:type 4a pilus biogenesis protein PilO n=1 Tax=Halobacteriovorax sp. BALOs_7 TaxID=2109558 RepID=UPI0013C3E764|nr:type 4a pilus biogenesis protein PilO [Halobacteriovorax sp. BALOs_7]
MLLILYGCFLTYEAYSEIQIEREALQNEAQSFEARINKKKRELKKLKDYEKDVERKKEEIEIVAQKLEETQRRLPKDISDNESINLIKKIGESLKIKEVQIIPSGQEENGFYITKFYTFSGKGTYLQFLLLLENISKQERILNVRDINLSKISKTNKSRYEIINLAATIESYIYNSNHRENRGIEEIERRIEEESSKKKEKPKRKKRKK